MARKICNYTGCNRIISPKEIYCFEHKLLNKKNKAFKNKRYDKKIRDKKSTEFYNSKEWIKTREYILGKYKGLDLYAFFIDKKIIYATTVHHIEELKENWSKRLDIGNLIPLSTSSHNRIHKMYEKDKQRTQKQLKELIDR